MAVGSASAPVYENASKSAASSQIRGVAHQSTLRDEPIMTAAWFHPVIEQLFCDPETIQVAETVAGSQMQAYDEGPGPGPGPVGSASAPVYENASKSAASSQIR